MSAKTSFRFESGDVTLELSGSEEFLRRVLPGFMPYVAHQIAGEPAPQAAAAPAPAPADPSDLKSWFDARVPRGARLTMQDHILVFAFWMRSFKKYIFTSEDVRRGFASLEMSEPKSLLQLLGTLKREHNLILGTERRGEYMLNTTGIERARSLLDLPAGEAQESDEDQD